MSSYREQLKSPRWQRRRLERLAAADWKCTGCGDSESTLHVHHRQYIRGRAAWEYDDGDLAVLCESCHAAEHRPVRRRVAHPPIRTPADLIAWGRGERPDEGPFPAEFADLLGGL